MLPKRWVAERTVAWLARYRMHARDYERNPQTREAMIYISMIRLILRRLTRQSGFEGGFSVRGCVGLVPSRRAAVRGHRGLNGISVSLEMA